MMELALGIARAMVHHLDRPQPTAGYRFVTHSHGFGVLQIYVQPLAAALASIPLRVKLMKRLLTAFHPHEGPLLPLFGDGSDSGTDKALSCSAKSDMLALLAMSFLILQIHKASGSSREREKTKILIQWPAWRAIEQPDPQHVHGGHLSPGSKQAECQDVLSVPRPIPRA